MDIKHSIEYQENEASKKIFSALIEHVDYIDKIYNFCFEMQDYLNGKTIKEVGQLLCGQMMILMRITDFLRCIRSAIINGYPEQAGTLASSILELSHTGIYFSYDIEAVQKWSTSNSGKMPQVIGVSTYKKLMEKNYSQVNLDPKPELDTYMQLCWMKHSHPTMQDIQINNNKANFQFGPYTDEKSINHAWFAIEHSGRLTEMLISHMIFPDGLLSNSDLKKKNDTLNSLMNIRKILNQKAQKRFNNANR